MNNSKVLGIDIGGTKIHIGIVHAGEIIAELKLPTYARASKEHILAEIIEGIQSLMDDSIVGIGVGVPGLVDEHNGIVYGVQNIPSFKEIHLKQYLEEYFGKPVYLTNDANSFVLGEKLYGRGQAYRNLVGLTLGTGLGGGIILNNKLYSGTLSSAGEFGGIPYLDKTLEDYCSGKFFQQQYGITGNELHAKAQQGEAAALEIMDQFGRHLGNAIKIILFFLSPQAIFLGGSVSHCFPFFQEAMLESLHEFPFRVIKEKLIIECSTMQNGAVLGAAALFHLKSQAFTEEQLV